MWYNAQNILFMSENKNGFGIELKARRPLWQDMLTFCLTVAGIWAASHVVLNWGAYAQIAEFRVKEAREIIAEAKQDQRPEVFVNEASSLLSASVITKGSVHQIAIPDDRTSVMASMEMHPSDDRIVVPRIGKNVPLVTVPNHTNWDALENDIQTGLEQGVVVHPVSREPDTNGNFFITGHSSYFPWDDSRFNDDFALLHEVVVGDEVEVYRRGKKYVYVIEESLVVTPDQVDVLSQPNDRKQLTLMTCTPIGTAAKRLILVATPKEEATQNRVKVQ